MPPPSQVDGGLITAEEFESAISTIIPIRTELDEPQAVALNSSRFLQVTRLLEISGKREWSLRPRTYAVLRMMGRVDLTDSFVAEGLFDISLPYSERTFPDALKNPGTRSKFLELQSLVLTEQAIEVENSGGRHRHLLEDGDVHFRRIRGLGRGGFGEVDHVWSRLSHNEFARKRMPRGRTFNKDKAAIASFEQELGILKRLSHHHLVKLVGSYTDPKYVGLIMLPVADCNLGQFLEANPFPSSRISCLRHFYGCLSSALLYLHTNKIRHKDVKPGNILVHGENVLFTDFGTSLDWTEMGQSTTASRPSAISVSYCSPEVAAWEPRNTLSDIYSLGCVFLEITTVLRGDSVRGMKDFFASHGTNANYVRANQEAMYLWLEEIHGRPTPRGDNEPITWVRSMLEWRPEDRPTASQLVEWTCCCGGDFCGPCCIDGEDDESVESYQGSLHNEEITSGEKGRDKSTRERQPHSREHPGGVATGRRGRRLSTQAGGEPPGERQPVASNEILTARKTPSSDGENRVALEDFAYELLLDNGFDIKTAGENKSEALLWAAKNGYYVMVRLLLDNGADIEARENTKQRTALCLAASAGHETAVQLLVERGANIESKDGKGWVALILAAGKGHKAIVQLLIEKGASIETKMNEGWTALLTAAYKGYEEVVQLLIKEGADVEAKTDDGSWAALHIAAEIGHEAVVEQLVQGGANLQATGSNGWTALLKAAELGHEAVVGLLVHGGANVEAKNGGGFTALSRAARLGYDAVVRLLIQGGADVDAENDEGWTPLILAASRGHKAVVQSLIESRASIEAKMDQGWTALLIAAYNGHEEVIQLLIKAGANMEVKHQGYTALLKAIHQEHEEVARLLIRGGADIEAKGDEGWTPLLLAASNGHKDMVQLLIWGGADVEVRCAGGLTALLAAAYRGHGEVVELLIKEGADMEVKHQGCTALLAAAYQGCEAVVGLLVRGGADIEAKDTIGFTALLAAARKGHWEIVRLLKGGDLKAKDIYSLKALIGASDQGYNEVVRSLAEMGADVDVTDPDG